MQIMQGSNMWCSLANPLNPSIEAALIKAIPTSLDNNNDNLRNPVLYQYTMVSTSHDASTPSLHPRFTFHDKLRIALFLIVPIYARFCIEPSFSSTFRHVYVIFTTGVCIVHFSSGMIDLDLIGDIVHGLWVSSVPYWIKSLSLVGWTVPDTGGWRGEIFYWAFIATQLSQLLPEYYGSDVQVRYSGLCPMVISELKHADEQMLCKEYNYAYPHTTNYINTIAIPVVYCIYWRKDYSWYHILTIWAIISSCIEYAYLAYLNYG
jgi:hypothetical protein